MKCNVVTIGRTWVWFAFDWQNGFFDGSLVCLSRKRNNGKSASETGKYIDRMYVWKPIICWTRSNTSRVQFRRSANATEKKDEKKEKEITWRPKQANIQTYSKKDRQKKRATCKANKTAADRLVFSQLEIFSRSDHFERVRCHHHHQQQPTTVCYSEPKIQVLFPSTAVIVELSLYVVHCF